MNDMQKKTFELLKLFINICEKLSLKYYLVCGSALGAVKYHGFIPWDDDIDVCLLRDDYELFLKKANDFIPDHVFLQNYRTDPRFPHVFSKLRDSNTTCIEKGLSHLNINHGIYIDIFPLDGYPQKKHKQFVFDIRKKLYSWKQYCALRNNSSYKVRVRNRIFCILGYDKRTAITLAHMDKMFCKYHPKDSKLWCNHGNWQGKLEYASRDQYGEGIIVDFEGIPVRIPEKYNEYLSQKYGDWRNDPPLEKQKSHHHIEVLDVSKSYKEYL